ncbi:MAG TPA: cytochrome c oxidase subunit 3 family protein [Thermodesulfobacteriota bacterium]|nr:cytochrome c oxidase subunit 3 family protein [Thermodesulfobacteriota bacterium]
MSAPPSGHADPRVAFETAKLGLWTFLATEVLLFGALFTAYTVFRVKYPALFQSEHLKLNRVLGTLNTLVLITSSLAVALGVDAIRRGKARLLEKYYGVTVLLGAVFLCVKYIEWTEEFHHGLYPGTNIFFSLYFMMTGLHGIHVILGMGALTYVVVLSKRGRFSGSYHTPVEVVGLYWHFVDLVWIYLFPLLYLIG